MTLGWRPVVAALLLTAAACGGGGGGGGDEPGPVAGPGGDAATARTIVLRESDMPAGWRGVVHTEDPAERERARKLSACLDQPDPETIRSAIVYGPDLSRDRSQVSAIATVLTTVEDARADLAGVRGPKYSGCVIAAFNDSVQRQAPDAVLRDVAAEALSVEAFGDASVGLRITANLVYADRTDRIVADLVYMVKDRATVSLTFFSFDQPFPPTLQQSLVSRVGHRIASA